MSGLARTKEYKFDEAFSSAGLVDVSSDLIKIGDSPLVFQSTFIKLTSYSRRRDGTTHILKNLQCESSVMSLSFGISRSLSPQKVLSSTDPDMFRESKINLSDFTVKFSTDVKSYLELLEHSRLHPIKKNVIDFTVTHEVPGKETVDLEFKALKVDSIDFSDNNGYYDLEISFTGGTMEMTYKIPTTEAEDYHTMIKDYF